ncbi:MAG: type II toxin-antitoxin system RelE/ParE family toxin [Chloroflexota bacterium]
MLSDARSLMALPSALTSLTPTSAAKGAGSTGSQNVSVMRRNRLPTSASIVSTDAAAVTAAMKDIRDNGVVAARHLHGDIYEVRADGNQQTFRILFAEEGTYGHILLSLTSFSKKTRKTPRGEITLAEKRLRDWRDRGSNRWVSLKVSERGGRD